MTGEGFSDAPQEVFSGVEAEAGGDRSIPRYNCHQPEMGPKVAAHPYQGSGTSAQPAINVIFPQQPGVSTMDADSQQPKRRDGALSALNTAIEAMNLAKEVSSVTPAKAVFGSVSILLTMIRVRCLLSLRQCPYSEYVQLGLRGQQGRLCRARVDLRQRM